MPKKKKIKKFEPANEKQKKFLESTKEQILYSGAVGAGKSLMGCVKLFMFNLKYPGMRSAIIRKRATDLKASTLITLLEDVIPPSMIVEHNKVEGFIKHKTPMPGVLSTIVYTGLDKKAGEQYPQKIGSTQFGHIFFDEGIEGTEGDWNMLVTRLRYKLKYLSEEQNNLIPRQITTATNPDAPTHWLYNKFFLENNPECEKFLTTPYENPHLPEKYLKSLERTLKGFYRQRLLEGLWVQSEGVIYKDFNPAHQVKKVNTDPKTYKEIIIGADSNYPLPRSALAIGILPERIEVFSEFYKEKSHIEDLMKWIESIRVKSGQALTVYHDPSDPTCIDKIDGMSYVSGKKAKNNVVPGISVVASYFTENKIVIDESCKGLLTEIPGYCWAKSKEGEKPEKVADHACDSLRYALYSYEERLKSAFFFS